MKTPVAETRQSWKQIISWSLYDFGNSAFATTVMAGFFPLFFKQYWSAGTPASRSTFYLGAANSIAGLAVVVLAPFLGAIADRGGTRKKFLFCFAVLGIWTSSALFFPGQGQWMTAAVLFVMAVVGFSGGNVFYDSLLVEVAREDKVDLVSATGYSLGYLGGGLLFAVNVWMYISPGSFGMSGPVTAVKVSFLSVGIWWAVFTVPLLLYVQERGPGPVQAASNISLGLEQLVSTFREIRKLKVVFLFLVAYWLYIDGVYTIIKMAVDYGLSAGLESRSLIMALLITQFVGFPSAIVFGKLGEKLGPKLGIYVALMVYLGMTVWGYFLKSEADFFAMAVTIGLVQGGVQSLSRSFYTRIIPRNCSAEFFGFYNMVGKFGSVLGPFLVGWLAVATGSTRNGIFAITFLLAVGGFIFVFVDEEEGRRNRDEFEGEDRRRF